MTQKLKDPFKEWLKDVRKKHSHLKHTDEDVSKAKDRAWKRHEKRFN